MDFKSLLSKFDVISSKQTLNEGWEDMMKASKEKSEKETKEKGTGKFDKKETSTGTVYTRKSSTFDDGGEDKDVKKAKKKEKSKKEVDESMASLLKTLDAISESEKQVEEDDMEEGNEFSGARDAAIKAGKTEFEVKGKKYQVKESKKPDEDGDGVPDWADKKPGEDDNEDKDDDKEDKDDDKDDDKKEVDEAADMTQIPAYVRKQKQQTQQTAQTATDKRNQAADAKVWSSKRTNEDLQECYDQAMSQMEPRQESGMNVSSSMDTKTGTQSLTVSAQGQAADQLAQLLKLSGILDGGSRQPEEMEIEVDEAGYANQPQPAMQGVATQMQQGNDLNRAKGTYPKVSGGDNPMQAVAAMEARAKADLEKIEKRLMEQLDAIKVFKK